MNIYLLAWNMRKEMQMVAVSAMQKITSIYPQLDPETFWSRSSTDNQVFLAAIQPPMSVIAPRRYLDSKGDVVVTYSGIPVNVRDTYKAHCADHLKTHWSELNDDLEGQYVAILCDFKTSRVEVLTDNFGIEPVFYYQHHNLWIVSNSLWLINQCVEAPASLDPLGVSLLLRIGWPCSDRTMLSHASLIQAASHWKWESGDSEPSKRTFYSRRSLGRIKKKRSFNVKHLAEQMTLPLVLLAKYFGTLDIQLTGGGDSRLVAALAIHGQLPSRYYTFSHINPLDSYIAKLIAKSFNLEHRSLSVKPEEILKIWDKAWWYLLRQNDGMVGYEEIPYPNTIELMRPVERLKTTIWGSGGNFARGGYYPHFDNMQPTSEEVVTVLKKMHVNTNNELILPHCASLTDNYLKEYVDGCIADDVRPIDIPDMFYLYQRIGRWPGIMARTSMPLGSLYSPFTTKAFIENAFSMPPNNQQRRVIHYELIKFCVPELHKIRYDDPWKFKKIGGNAWLRRLDRSFGIRGKAASKLEATETSPLNYIEIKLEQLRELCLSNNNDILWHLVNRDAFERITSKNTSPAERAPYLTTFNAMSMVYSYAGLAGC